MARELGSRHSGTRLKPGVASEWLQREEIPTLIFGGRSHLPHAIAFVIEFSPGDRKARQKWLRTLAPEITYGHDRSSRAHVVAFTAEGLQKLGLGTDCLASFPTAFQAGMTSPGRSKALGDVDGSEPGKWDWGGDNHSCDAILILYAETAVVLNELMAERLEELKTANCRPVCEIALTPLVQGRVTEPFGFTDGVSQPVLRGTPRASQRRHQGHEIAAGEFVLGYDTTSGHRRISPLVAGVDDPSGILPSSPSGPATSFRDLGRNGTFLVVRQLEQDVDGFDTHLREAAEELADQGALPKSLPLQERQDLVAAKMVGRWKNGSSLVRHPNRPGQSRDNDFLFVAEDPLGLACPLGAHIRRANPRDSLMPGTIDPLAITAGHRLLRVGRAYDPPKPGAKRGILFMCLNADIEMQFEMVQQSWLNRKDFNGLRNETDPIVGGSQAPRRFTVPSLDGPKQLHDLASFVTVKGGAYFFMPSRSAMRYLAELP